MKSVTQKFYMFGVVLTLAVTFGLLFQFNYFNQRLAKEMEASIILARNNIAADLNYEIMIHRQMIADTADYISMDNQDNEDILKYLKKIMAKHPSFYTVYFGTTDNVMINGSGWIPPKDFDLRTRPWYKKALSEDKLVFTEAFVNASKDMLVITIAQPVYNSKKQLLGVVAGDVSMEEIVALVKDKKIRGMGYSFLIDGKGNILAHPNYIYDYTSKLKNINENSEMLKEYIAQGKTGTAYIDLDGVSGYLAYQPIEHTDWMLGSFIPHAEYMQTSNQLIRMFNIVLISSLFGFIFIIMLQKKILIEPVLRLENDVQKIDISNRVDYRVPEMEKDPFYNIRKSINIALDKTQEFFTRLLVEEEELAKMNSELTTAMEQLAATGEELRNHNNELIESQRQLAESQERNNSIIKAMPDLLFIIDHDGRFLDCQVSDDKLLYMPRKNFIGRTLWEVLPKEIAELSYEKLRQVIDSGELVSFEYELDVSGVSKNYELRMVKSNNIDILAVVRDISDLKKMEKRLEYLSYRDQLTGLYNRRYFEEELKRQSDKENLPLSVIMADVNGLKLVNDSFGHLVGDELLIKIAEVLKRGCRMGDIISRIGGDEFVMLLPKTDAYEAESIIKYIKALASNERVGSIELSISLGKETKVNEEQGILEVLKKAEDRMYKTKLFESPSMRGKTIKVIINALYEKNKREEQHSHRVADLSVSLGKALELSETEIQELKTIGLLHDIGKIAIDESILNKSGKLTDEEWQEMKRHSEIGYRILSTVNDMAEMGEYVLAHHERWDGNGYPRGLKDVEIPLQSRIISIVDAYDAMTSERTYRSPLPEEIAIQELQKNAGSQFDPEITKIFIEKVLTK